jgi:hypothetical protein
MPGHPDHPGPLPASARCDQDRIGRHDRVSESCVSGPSRPGGEHGRRPSLKRARSLRHHIQLLDRAAWRCRGRRKRIDGPSRYAAGPRNKLIESPPAQGGHRGRWPRSGKVSWEAPSLRRTSAPRAPGQIEGATRHRGYHSYRHPPLHRGRRQSPVALAPLGTRTGTASTNGGRGRRLQLVASYLSVGRLFQSLHGLPTRFEDTLSSWLFTEP